MLAEALHLGFPGDHEVLEGGVVGFGAHGVEFAVHFLGEKIERASGGLGAGHEAGEFGEVAVKAGDFFRKVAAVGEEGDFLDEALVVEGEGKVGFLKAAEQGGAVKGGDEGGFAGDLLEEFLEGGEAGGEVGVEVGAFAEAGLFPGGEGLGEGTVGEGLEGFGGRGGALG